MKTFVTNTILTGLLLLIAASLTTVLIAVNQRELIVSTSLFSISCVIALMILKIK